MTIVPVLPPYSPLKSRNSKELVDQDGRIDFFAVPCFTYSRLISNLLAELM
jgi:hypothetical protein